MALGLYLAALFVVAEISRRARKDLSPSDHFLASRELGVLVLFLTLYATAYSGNSLLGYPGEAYRRGFSWIMAVGFMTSIIVAFHLLAPKLRPLATRRGFVSPGDWVRHRFNGDPGMRPLVVAVAVLMSLALANFLFAQLKAMGELAEQVTEGLVPYELGVIGLAATVLFYETRGGMRAVAWTDTAQGLLMLLGLMALLGWLLAGVGGLEAITRQISELRPEAVVVPDGDELRNWISTIVLLGLASVVYPQAIQRIYAARSGATLKRAFALMTFMPLTTTLVVTLIGVAAIPRFSHLDGAEADRVMPLLLGEWAAVGTLAALAAVAVFIGAHGSDDDPTRQACGRHHPDRDGRARHGPLDHAVAIDRAEDGAPGPVRAGVHARDPLGGPARPADLVGPRRGHRHRDDGPLRRQPADLRLSHRTAQPLCQLAGRDRGLVARLRAAVRAPRPARRFARVAESKLRGPKAPRLARRSTSEAKQIDAGLGGDLHEHNTKISK